MEYDHILVNFCERKLYTNQTEYINAFSALYICAISYYNLLKTHNLSTTIIMLYCCIFVNGLAAFLYHWYAWYIFKLFDEFSMIIPIWIGISKVLLDLHYPIYCIGIFTLVNICLLVLDVFMWFDDYFPICFLIELLILLPLYCQNIKYYKDIHRNGLKGIIICSSSGIIWAITEVNCNKYLIFGHAIWHIGMSTGICYKIKYF